MWAYIHWKDYLLFFLLLIPRRLCFWCVFRYFFYSMCVRVPTTQQPLFSVREHVQSLEIFQTTHFNEFESTSHPFGQCFINWTWNKERKNKSKLCVNTKSFFFSLSKVEFLWMLQVFYQLYESTTIYSISMKWVNKMVFFLASPSSLMWSYIQVSQPTLCVFLTLLCVTKNRWKTKMKEEKKKKCGKCTI